MKSVYVFIVIVFVLATGVLIYEQRQAKQIQNEYPATLSPIQLAGKNLFFDTRLSEPLGTSCASCHHPDAGFSDKRLTAFSVGSKGITGTRNAPSIAYAAFSPHRYFNEEDETYVGGYFWDGRAVSIEEQIEGPLFNHAEMNAGSKTKLMRKLSEAPYKQLLEHVFGNKIFTDSNYAFECIKSAIARYEESSELSPFSSKFDYYLAGKVSLTDKEKWGLELFNDPKKGNCAACHPSTHDAISGKVLFTDFTYDNIGLPAHPNSIQNRDVGQGTHLGKSENGKYKVPTLRNVALTAPYFHNGVINNLHDAVEFYNSRNSGKFGKPEIEENMNTDELSELGLTAEEVDAIVAFLHTLTDGYEANKNADATQFIRISKR